MNHKLMNAGVNLSLLISLIYLLTHIPFIVAKEVDLPSIPAGAQGVVYVENASEGQLLYLHGISGKGIYVAKGEPGEVCVIPSFPVIAGGFDGQGIEIAKAKPIRLVVYSKAVSERLKAGEQVVSEDWVLSLPNSAVRGDIGIESGLSLQQGFILHPRKFWSSWFSSRWRQASCKAAAHFTAAVATGK
ncbi:hypothetical protein ACRRS0_15125 [Agarivorans sp. QJM3NY_29]|uniref:hypothetical protein n=1 Tax=unclassified Agarivorans TaxID=2636026 RepID=UPI003D7DD9EC